MNIVLIDDDPATNIYHEVKLKENLLTVSVLCFNDARDVIKRINSKSIMIDIIFCDKNMPFMTGWDFIKVYEIYFQEKKSTARVCLLSDLITPKDHIEATKYESLIKVYPKSIDTPYFSDSSIMR